jgi:YbgC/YbaW family acyl-CoA thioester hydrolase
LFNDQFTIEWGDCDEAGIVFYPNYFYWFDCTFQRFLRARGLSQRELKKRFGGVTPLVQVGADFTAPARYDDVVATQARIESWDERRFRVAYQFTVGERPVAHGFEVRAWATIAETAASAAPPSRRSSGTP